MFGLHIVVSFVKCHIYMKKFLGFHPNVPKEV